MGKPRNFKLINHKKKQNKNKKNKNKKRCIGSLPSEINIYGSKSSMKYDYTKLAPFACKDIKLDNYKKNEINVFEKNMDKLHVNYVWDGDGSFNTLITDPPVFDDY